MTAGSDAHISEMVGQAVTEVGADDRSAGDPQRDRRRTNQRRRETNPVARLAPPVQRRRQAPRAPRAERAPLTAMTTPSSSDLRGASPDRICDALRGGGPPRRARLRRTPPRSPNREGPVLVRDVLGREPLCSSSSGAARIRRLGVILLTPVSGASIGPTSTTRNPFQPGPSRRVRGPSASGRSRTRSRSTQSPDRPRSRALGAVLGEIKTEANRNDLAVAFSGGIDSGVVVAAAVPDAPCYVAGFEGCHDIEAAREAATAMELDLRVVEITHDDLARAVGRAVAATGRRNPMDVAIAVPAVSRGGGGRDGRYRSTCGGTGRRRAVRWLQQGRQPAGDDRVVAGDGAGRTD